LQGHLTADHGQEQSQRMQVDDSTARRPSFLPIEGLQK